MNQTIATTTMTTTTTMISMNESGLRLEIEITPDGDVRLLHLGLEPFDPALVGDDGHRRWFRLVELQIAGENQEDHHGSKYTGTCPGRRLRYQGHEQYSTALGAKLEVRQAWQDLRVVSHFQFFRDMPAVRCWTTLSHVGAAGVWPVEYVSSFALTGIVKEGSQPRDEKCVLHVPHNTWHGEAQWRAYKLPELGMGQVQSHSGSWTVKRLSFDNVGTWSSNGYLPMAAIENAERGTTCAWQIEHNGSWHWELSTIGQHLYLQVSGPTFAECHWCKPLGPGESFESVPVGVVFAAGGPAQAFEVLTRYRRAIRRPHDDYQRLPVIFNDYMNCLFGDPTTEKLRPLIGAAAKVGCEYFVVDAGWYAENNSWADELGEWLPSKKRFPNGIEEVINLIRAQGMVPGLWLELEAMGIHSPLAKSAPDDWFFCRNGKRLIDKGRHQLDFRNPAVRQHADQVMARLVEQLGVGYIKMDYNSTAGPGTQVNAPSLGEGLLQHNRAYLAWLDDVCQRYPRLVVENCASGGMRMDYAMLSRSSIQSTSDQTDYLKTCVIAASVFSAITPEQAGIWSYPVAESQDEEVIFNMVNAMLGRVHLSGRIDLLDEPRLAWVSRGVELYKSVRELIPRSLPAWPLGMPRFDDAWVACGLRTEDQLLLAVWRRSGGGDADACDIPLPFLRNQRPLIELAYPKRQGECDFDWSAPSARLRVRLRPGTARLFSLRSRREDGGR